MTVYVYPADVAGCGYYRLIWPARELIKKGYDVKVILPAERNNLNAVIDNHGKVTQINFPDDAEVMVLQRITHKYMAQAIPMIRNKGCAVVIDMDDDLSTIHPFNAAWVNFHPKSHGTTQDGKMNIGDHSWHHAQTACDAASLVTLSANHLVYRYAVHGRSAILPNCVPASYLEVPHVDSDVVGWAGSLASHPDDLDVMGLSISMLQREGMPFKIVGDPGGVKNKLLLDDEPLDSGIVPIEEWPKAVSTLGIGVTPLADSKFNKSKSWLKPMEYAAVGVPMLMSPRDEYTRFHKTLKIGRLVKDGTSSWRREIRRLWQSEDLRLEMSQRGREAASAWTYERRAEDWWEAWQQAAKIG